MATLACRWGRACSQPFGRPRNWPGACLRCRGLDPRGRFGGGTPCPPNPPHTGFWRWHPRGDGLRTAWWFGCGWWSGAWSPWAVDQKVLGRPWVPPKGPGRPWVGWVWEPTRGAPRARAARLCFGWWSGCLKRARAGARPGGRPRPGSNQGATRMGWGGGSTWGLLRRHLDAG